MTTSPEVKLDRDSPVWKDFRWCRENYPHLQWAPSGDPSVPVYWHPEHGYLRPTEYPPPDKPLGPDTATRLRATLTQVLAIISAPNPAITDTLWYSKTETLADFIQAELQNS